MKRPMARPVATAGEERPARAPRAFAPGQAMEPLAAEDPLLDADLPAAEAPPARRSRLGAIAAWAAGLLLSLSLGLAADRLIRDLFDAHPWLGWTGMAIAAVLLAALLALIAREAFALRRLRVLDGLRDRASAVLVSDRREDGAAVLNTLLALYHARPDLARARVQVDADARHAFDGADIIRLAERGLMEPLDIRAKSLTAASARRVALVTAVSPRALVDVGFVVYESVKLGGQIARLYGARPGFLGSLRLCRAILSHLAVTGGLVLTDGFVEQIVGHGLAARVSARLGEGLVNGLMTVRVGIAAMRVTRPLPFDTQKQPQVRDFLADLTTLSAGEKS